jgi:RND superfamily putative drug exporter
VWARFVYRNRRAVLTVSVLALAAILIALTRGGTLSTGTIAGIESTRGLRRIEEALGQAGESSFTVIFRSNDLSCREAAFREAMAAALAPLRADPRVLSVRSPDDLPGPLAEGFRSRDGKSAIAVVGLREELRLATRTFRELRAKVRSPVLEPTFTGWLAFKSDLDDVLERDLRRSEIVTFPLVLAVLLVVFASVVAATLPVGVGGIAVAGGVAGVFALSRVMDMAAYAVNFASLIGLGVAIDYSLFIVSRYRDELATGLDVPRALERAMATAGRAVVFSGVAVGIGLGGLLFFPRSYLAAIGLGGAIVVLLAVLVSITFLPALLAVLGRRIDAGRIPLAPAFRAEGFWRRLAAGVMARPVLVLAPTLAALLLAGAPFLRFRMAVADISCLPRTEEARRGHEFLREQFPDQVATRIAVVVDFPTEPALTRERVGALYDLSRRMAKIPGVARVESIFDLPGDMDREDYQDVFGVPPAEWPETLRPFIPESVRGRTVVLAAVTPARPATEEARAIVRAIRADRRVGDGTLLVTGQTANDVDSTDFIVGHTPAAVAFVMGATGLTLFLLLRSIVLPVKAIVMNLLSISASFGALVWIFQEGHGASLLGFEAAPVEPTLPVLLFCTVFGLSMDYEVLLLSRIQEEWERTGDNARAVAEGLERSGRLITSAALIMVVVFLAFALAQVIMVKAMGLGLAIAIGLDATAVRLLIVPATMRLFGGWNWWAPGRLARAGARQVGLRS